MQIKLLIIHKNTKTMKMRKITLVLGVLFMGGVLAASMTSCGTATDNAAATEQVEEGTADEAATTEEATDETAKCGEGKCGEGKCGGEEAPVEEATDAVEDAVDAVEEAVEAVEEMPAEADAAVEAAPEMK